MQQSLSATLAYIGLVGDFEDFRPIYRGDILHRCGEIWRESEPKVDSSTSNSTLIDAGMGRVAPN